jgi:hypothetical protein
VFNFESQSVFICFAIPKIDILQVQKHDASTSGISRVTDWFVACKLDIELVYQKSTSNYGSWPLPMWVLISKLDALKEISDIACWALSF